MAIAKIILLDSPSRVWKDGTSPVCLRISHKNKRKYFFTNRSALPSQWNYESSRFRRNYPDYKVENQFLLSLESKAQRIIREFDMDLVPFNLEQFEKKFLIKDQPNNLVAYFSACMDKLIELGKVGSASPYRTTINALVEFMKDQGRNIDHMQLTDISYKFLVDFEHWLRTKRKCKDNTISVYVRTIRAVLNKAIKEEVIRRDSYPFYKYRVSERFNTETSKRAISLDKIREIEALEFEPGSKLHLAQSFFLFSFYTRGMNFVDMAYLTEDNIDGDRLHYIRQKTGKPFSIKLLPQAQKILDFFRKYKYKAGPYIFPIFDTTIHKTVSQMHHRKKTALKEINKLLKEIAKMVGIEGFNLTTYASRHSYATTLKKNGIPTAKISEALGHTTEKVTQAYLKSFENSELDEIDEKLL